MSEASKADSLDLLFGNRFLTESYIAWDRQTVNLNWIPNIERVSMPSGYGVMVH